MSEEIVGQRIIDSFINFLENEWNWKVTYDKEKIITSSKMCSCSEGFAERMFSLVLQKKVRAEVVRLYIRGKESCIYRITIPD
jgi:hypothetical protein